MFKDDKNTILIWVTTLFIDKKKPQESSPNVLYDINANFCSFNIKWIDLLIYKILYHMYQVYTHLGMSRPILLYQLYPSICVSKIFK